MNLATRIALGAVGTAFIALLGLAGAEYRPDKEPAEKPQLALLTSLPILFGEQFSLEAPTSPLRQRLEADYRLAPVGVADAQSLKGQRLLFMAHARAQPAEALGELDQWVRDGGHLLILTDPLLSWHSERALGDRLRPPINFADTALLAHWGLTLSGPTQVGPVTRTIDALEILAVSPGSLTSNGACSVDEGGFVARCVIGRGKVTLIADADWLNVDDSERAIDGPTQNNLNALTRELARLRQP